mmetsp:Transcript_32028/g.63938  ORF Transcript_32028/g.63938 Transcript_32028/m.63938 type:complete len:113 (+) Transcript_32028:233-571(+)
MPPFQHIINITMRTSWVVIPPHPMPATRSADVAAIRRQHAFRTPSHPTRSLAISLSALRRFLTRPFPSLSRMITPDMLIPRSCRHPFEALPAARLLCSLLCAASSHQHVALR